MTAGRASDAGVTLVEMLVVLVLIGVLTAAVGLSLGSADRTSALDREADLLVARLNRAADEVALSGQPVAFLWEDDHYGFRVAFGADWQEHPVPLLRETHVLGASLRFDGPSGRAGSAIVTGDLVPASGDATTLRIVAGPDSDAVVRFDGLTAMRRADLP